MSTGPASSSKLPDTDSESKINWWEADDPWDSSLEDSEETAELPKNHRQVLLFNPEKQRCNRIRTTHYSWYSFIPMVLFEQFSQPANAYFLVIVLLQMIPAISNTNGLPLTAIPLSFVVGVSALKDAYEDLRRRASDRSENFRKTRRVDAFNSEKKVKWMDVRPGHLIRVNKGEQIPCDGLLLSSNLEGGECFVQTMNLDGETNLKKKASALTEDEWQEVQQVGNHLTPLQLECEPPTTDLYNFNGALITASGATRGVTVGSLLLRGTKLMQTEWVLMMAVFVGHDTRAMMNAQSARYKLSKMDVELSKVVYMLFACQLGVCFVLAVAAFVWHYEHASAWYLEGADDLLKGGLLPVSYGTWLLLTCNTVPISLMVTLTVVKFVQGMFIFFDRSFGKQGAGVQTSQVIESLGQITHIFSDKTGTLTRNLMVYKACSVAGRVYGITSDGTDIRNPTGRIFVDNVDFHSAAFRRDLAGASVEAGASGDGGRPAKLAMFLLVHGVCHTVSASTPSEEEAEEADISSVKRSIANGGESVAYDASSPDELALVSMARAMGLEFLSMRHGCTRLIVHGNALGAALQVACGWRGATADSSSVTAGELTIDVLDVCEFDNERKRMSTVVRFPDGRLVLLMKGADTSVLPHCTDISDQKEACEEHLWQFATRGLRTLCFAMCVIPEDEYQAWHTRYVAAQKMFTEDRFSSVQQLAIEIETRPMTLLGATAIEDLLQEGVPDTIEQFRAAGIRVWVLTGDKVETAISIALSCKLLTEDMNNHVVDATNAREVRNQLKGAGVGEQPALTVTGAALAVALETESLREPLFKVCNNCCAVICCRVSPKQKADVVHLVKSFEAAAVTLSIGDGANDVSMIITAHVGVGLAGKEGGQAASTADFAFDEFQHLRRLLFVHGRESYRRMSVLSLYNFYKNLALVFPLLLSSPAAGFTGQNIFHPWLVQVHNIIYSHVAVCTYGMFDRVNMSFADLELDVSNWGLRLFSRSALIVWVLAVILQASFYIKVAGHTMRGCAWLDGAPLDDAATQGNMIFVWAEMGVNLTMFFRHRTWFSWMCLPYVFNIGALFISLVITNYQHRGFGEGILSEVLTGNILRVFLATLLAMLGHCVIGEILINWDYVLARPISRVTRYLREKCGFEAAEPEVSKLSSQNIFQSRHEAVVKAKQAGHSHSLAELHSGADHVQCTEEEEESIQTSVNDVGKALRERVPPAPARFRSAPARLLEGNTERRPGSLARRPGSMASLGFAFSEECCNERERGRRASKSVDTFRRSILRSSISAGMRRHTHTTVQEEFRDLESMPDGMFGRRRWKSFDTAEIELSAVPRVDWRPASVFKKDQEAQESLFL